MTNTLTERSRLELTLERERLGCRVKVAITRERASYRVFTVCATTGTYTTIAAALDSMQQAQRIADLILFAEQYEP